MPHDKTNKMACAPSEDSDQPWHPPSLIRVFAVRMKKAWVLSYPLSTQRRLWLDWADAQTDLSLRWAHMPLCWFCHEAAHLLFPCRAHLMYVVKFLLVAKKLIKWQSTINPTCFSTTTVLLRCLFKRIMLMWYLMPQGKYHDDTKWASSQEKLSSGFPPR